MVEEDVVVFGGDCEDLGVGAPGQVDVFPSSRDLLDALPT